MRMILFAALTCLSLTALAQNSLDYFDKINAWGNVEVNLIPGDECTYTVLTNEENLKISVDNGKLKVTHRQNIDSWNNRIVLDVTYVELDQIHASAGSKIEHDGVLKAADLDLDFDTGANARLEIETKSVDAQVGEGSVLGLKGETIELKAKATTGAILKGTGLDAEIVLVIANTGAQASVHAKEAIEARASTGGMVSYTGNPDKVKSQEASGGNIRG